MSDKDFHRLDSSDQMLRQTIPCGPSQIHGTVVTIEFLHGFELFNTRPYHNYETWSNGYRVSGKGIKVEREDLDEAVREWCLKVKQSEAQGREDV